MDPEVYLEPKKFNPARWDVSMAIFLTHVCTIIQKSEFLIHYTVKWIQGYTPKAGTFIPFGAGTRLCPGNDLAKMEISIFLHYFLLGYQ